MTVSEALITIKMCVAQGRFHLVPRAKNQSGMIELGLTFNTLKSVILNLTKNNYYSGPSKDFDQSDGEIWVYAEDLNGTEAYIKLKIFHVDSVAHTKCLSVHPSERSMGFVKD
ncbi:type II toxin-antitoxin system MqsR family toxin [Vibrio diazotrophicus]|uniref:type II toxin-antitoxin system MqsR family toxin n=1 Tax=Vibrio diazotrophicus TaxID=685 RepID=UPI000693BEE5|nr:type II toxin-antitoxin system MqsR family toxin [Vibrio diazotrophicus]